MAGTVLNARVGDPAYGWTADHVEPGVSIRNRDEGAEYALHYLACIGNHAVITSGEGKGEWGHVTGEHAHMMVEFEPEVLERICIGDRIVVRAHGVGLKVDGFSGIHLKSVSPHP